MAATGFTVDTTLVNDVGRHTQSLAECAEVDLPPGLDGCGSASVAVAWDQALIAISRTYHHDLLPAVALWGAIVTSAGQWVKERDAALAVPIGTQHMPTIPDLAASSVCFPHPVFSGQSGAGLAWEPGNPGVGEFTDTGRTASWFSRLTDMAAEVAARFGDQLTTLGQAWTGDLGNALHHRGQQLHEALFRFAQLLSYAQPAADLNRYTQTVEDIARQAARVRDDLADTRAIITAATTALDDLARAGHSPDLTGTQLGEQHRQLVRQGRAEDDLLTLSRTLARLDDDRGRADSLVMRVAWQLSDDIASVTITPATTLVGGGPGATTANTVVSTAPVARAFIASTSAVEPFPDGLGTMGPPSCLQWITATPPAHDAGAGPFNSRPWTPADWITWWEAFIAASGAFITTWPHAGSHLLHYLDASGEDLILPVDTMLADSVHFGEIIAKHSDDLIDEAIDQAAASGTPHAVTFPIRTEWRGFTFDSTNDRDWYLAVGSANYAITGEITVTPPSPGSSQWTYTIDYQVTVDDRYNWDLGKSTPIAGTTIKDSDLAALHLAGFAQEFAMHGTSDPISKTGTR